MRRGRETQRPGDLAAQDEAVIVKKYTAATAALAEAKAELLPRRVSKVEVGLRGVRVCVSWRRWQGKKRGKRKRRVGVCSSASERAIERNRGGQGGRRDAKWRTGRGDVVRLDGRDGLWQ